MCIISVFRNAEEILCSGVQNELPVEQTRRSGNGSQGTPISIFNKFSKDDTLRKQWLQTILRKLLRQEADDVRYQLLDQC